MEGGGLTPLSAIPTVEPRWEEPGEAPSEVVQSLKEDALLSPRYSVHCWCRRDLADPDRAKAFLRCPSFPSSTPGFARRDRSGCGAMFSTRFEGEKRFSFTAITTWME